MATPQEAIAGELVVREQTHAMQAGGTLPPEVLRERVNVIQKVMKAVMKSDTHYGKIPGTQKPSLLKPGAEIIATTFQLGVDPHHVEDLGHEDCIRYRVRVKLFNQATGTLVGIGIGECSSDEEKYRWKKAVNDAEWMDTPETRRRKKHGQGQYGAYVIKQVRTQPADLANTILKMAKKRAFIDAVLTATGCSDMFTQDIEDLPEELRTAGLDTHDAAAPEPDPAPQRGNKAVTERVDRARSPGPPDADDDGDGETRTEDELAELFQEIADDVEKGSTSQADALEQLNYVTGLVKTCPDPEARARLRKVQGRVAKQVAGMAEGGGS